MVNQIRRPNPLFPRMDSVVRIGGIPIIETGIKSAENMYSRVKNSNRLFNWYFETTESAVYAAIETARPLINLMEGPIVKIDQIMCKSLDVIEQRVPSMYLPPQLIYWNTKEYMSDRIVRPVLIRANSVKIFGNIVLDSKVTNFAADRVDNVLDAADKYIEKYLPDSKDENDYGAEGDDKEKHVIQTIHHGQQVTRKLKRRLTLRTIAEAKALRKQSTEAINILVYAAELIVTDPMLALQKGRKLWEYLSEDEPENQARPQTIEELIVLLTRESARRVVHLVNFTFNYITKLPRSVTRSIHEIIIHFIYATESLLKLAHLENVKQFIMREVREMRGLISNKSNEIQLYTTHVLERFAIFLSGRMEPEKITGNSRRRIYPAETNNAVHNNINGVY